MEGNDHALQLLIEFKAQLDGAVKSRAELVEMRRQAIAMGVSTGDLDNQIAALDKDIATLGKKSMPEAKEEVKLFTTHGKEMHKLIHELNHVVPGLGLALKAALSPEGIGIAVLVLAVQQLISWFELAAKASEELKKNLEAMPELQGLLGATAGVRDALEEAHINTEKFFIGLQQAHENAVSVNDVLSATVNLLKAQSGMEDELAKKQKERELARLEFLHETKQLNDAQYIAAKAATEGDFSASAQSRKLKLDQRIYDETIGAASDAVFNKMMLERQQPGAQNADAAAKNAITTAEENVRRAKANAEKTNSRITGYTVKDGLAEKTEKPGLQDEWNALSDFQKEIAGKYKTVQDYHNADPSGNQFGDSNALAIRLRIALEEARAEESKWKAKQLEAEENLRAAKQAAVIPETNLANLNKKISELQNTIESLRKQVNEKAAALDVSRETANATTAINDQTNAQKAGSELAKTDAGKKVIAEREAAKRVRAGTATDEDKTEIQQFAKDMTGNNLSLKQSVEWLEAANNVEYFSTLVGRLLSIMEKATPQQRGDLEDRIKNLESQWGIAK